VSKQQKNVLEDDAPAPEIGLVPKSALKLKQPSQPDDQVVPQAQSIPEVADDVEPHHDSAAPVTDAVSLLDAPAPKTASPVVAQAQAPAPQPPVQPEQDFVTANHDRIVTGVRTQLLPNGGTMQLRLDPPDLGPLQVNVRMIDGAMTASFETSSDQATRLLSHSLGQLKTALETQGVSVEKLHVEQSPKDQQSGSSDKENQRDSQQQQDGARRDQQRRELLNRMWQRLAVGRDPLDMVA
jgi:flagellar hook-length control protein FliK